MNMKAMRCVGTFFLLHCLAFSWGSAGQANAEDFQLLSGLKVEKSNTSAIRFATFNTSLFRPAAGELGKELESGSDHLTSILSIINAAQPDVLLVNEFDYDEGKSAKLFIDKYLNAGADKHWMYHFTAAVNTGVDSKLDLDGNGKLNTPNDAWGFGTHPGQYGMLVVSKYPIDESAVRTFQNFHWHSMPKAMRPTKPDGQSYYSDPVWEQLRLSSKSHWDVPIKIGSKTVHFVVAHPTPPVFDGPEDRNGHRNHDEVRLLRDYVCEEFDGSYITDDKGTAGDLPKGASFVVAGDLNSESHDGDGIHAGIESLLLSASVNQSVLPSSKGAVQAAKIQGEKNLEHHGDARYDTCDFNDKSVGNLRCDYVVPSKDLQIVASGVFWPEREKLPEANRKILDVTDHRLVWVDLVVEP